MTETTRVGVEQDAWTLTGLGGKVYFFRPADSDINIETVAFHIGKLCRWTGGTAWFYSNAQHMCMVATIIQERLDREGVDSDSEEYWDQILAGLLHDGGEAHCNDVSSPLKHTMGGKYIWIEKGILQELFHRYGLDWAYLNQVVKDADNLASDIERTFLMPSHPDWPKKDPAKLPYKITRENSWGPDEAGDKWLATARYIIERRRAARVAAFNQGT